MVFRTSQPLHPLTVRMDRTAVGSMSTRWAPGSFYGLPMGTRKTSWEAASRERGIRTVMAFRTWSRAVPEGREWCASIRGAMGGYYSLFDRTGGTRFSETTFPVSATWMETATRM